MPVVKPLTNAKSIYAKLAIMLPPNVPAMNPAIAPLPAPLAINPAMNPSMKPPIKWTMPGNRKPNAK